MAKANKKSIENKKSKESQPAPRKKCSKCEKMRRVELDYFMSWNPIHADSRHTVCKQCIKEMIDDSYTIESVSNVLRMIDRPFISDTWEKAIEESTRTKKELFGNYMKLISMNECKYMNWADSVFEPISQKTDSNNENEIETVISKKKADNFILTDDLIDKWGDGYTPEELKAFERKYAKLINNYGEKTALHTEGLLTYIRYRVKEEMATAANQVREAKEWGTLASKAAQDAKINVSQLSKSDISGGVDVLSQLFEAVESEVGIIPLLPQLLEQPYDDADMIIWATVNYNRRLEDKPAVAYREIWNFYDEMLGEYFNQQGFNEEQIKEFKTKRNNVFRDLSQVYKEPLHESDGE